MYQSKNPGGFLTLTPEKKEGTNKTGADLNGFPRLNAPVIVYFREQEDWLPLVGDGPKSVPGAS